MKVHLTTEDFMRLVKLGRINAPPAGTDITAGVTLDLPEHLIDKFVEALNKSDVGFTTDPDGTKS